MRVKTGPALKPPGLQEIATTSWPMGASGEGGALGPVATDNRD